MANKLVRTGYVQIVPANPGRPPTPARTITTTTAVSGTLGGGGGGSGGSWVYGVTVPGSLADVNWVPASGGSEL